MTLEQFIVEYQEEIDRRIKNKSPIRIIGDEDRKSWIKNDWFLNNIASWQGVNPKEI